MYAVEKKYDIELKLKREMNNILELKAAAHRSSVLAGDVCNVLGACEQRLQQLESAVLPLYGDTAKLQHIYHNMELTAKSLDNVINYYMVSRELADLIQAGPHTSSKESLNAYTDALDKLAEAQNYFNKNNPQSVELENINQLYDSGVKKLENAFEELLNRNTRPLSPTALMDMIALEDDSSVDSFSVSNSSTSSAGLESMRASAAWLGGAGRAPLGALLAVRAQANRTALANFKDYLRTRSMAASPLMRSKQPHRSDSMKKSNKLKKGIEKRVSDIVSLAIGPRRSMNDSYSEESTSESMEEWECECCGSVAAALCRLVRAEQRYLLGLVPLPRLPALTQQIMRDCFAILTQDVERACARYRRLAARCGGGGGGAGAGGGWALLARLSRLAADLERAADPHAKQFQLIRANCQMHCLRALDDWLEGLRGDTSAPPVDGTVHQLTVSSLALLHQLAEHVHTLGPALATEPAYTRAASQILGAQDRDAVMLSIYMRKVLAQLNSQLRSKSETYPDALKAIFMLNNINHLLLDLRPEQGSNLLSVLSLAEPDCEANYTDMLLEYRRGYLQSWSKLIAHTSLEEPLPPGKLRDKDRQILKDKFGSFNREFDECTKSQRGYAVPDSQLRESLKRDNKEAILPPYTALYEQYGSLPFSKNPEKYVKYSPLQRGYAVPDSQLRKSLKRDNKEAILPPYTALYEQYGSLPSKKPEKYVKYSTPQISTKLDGYFDESA